MPESVPCSSAWSGGIKSANSMSSRALNTSDAEMLLCCLEVETSCALFTVHHVASESPVTRPGIVIDRRLDIRGSCELSVGKRCDGGGEGRGASPRIKTRTEIVYEYGSAFNKREHRVLLQLHILRNLVEGVRRV